MTEQQKKPFEPQEAAASTDETSAEHGIPSVAGKQAVKISPQLLMTAVTVIAILAGLLTFAFSKLSSSSESKPSANATATEQKFTSTRTLTIDPVPIKKEEPKQPEKAPEAQPQPQPQPVIQERAERRTLRQETKREPTLEERRFAAPLMGSDDRSAQAAPTEVQTGRQSANSLGRQTAQNKDTSQFASMLNAVDTPRSKASLMGDRSLILPKGTFIDCILETRVNTTVPGMTSCVIAQDIYSANGRVLLIERGSKAIGEYKGSVANGLDRIFVLWTELQTPHGVRVRLDSPGADALGGSGLEGYTDHHWWRRFGTALLFSLIQDGFDFVINTQTSSSGGVNYYENTSDGMEEIIKEAMRQSGNIPPTLTKNQGERIGIFVARDVDFSAVYRLTAPTDRQGR